jgi:FtsP/CotA-like multicopper oxidase with cupredoxin domain
LKTVVRLCILFLAVFGLAASPPATSGQVRTYYIAADELDWNYFPSGIDKMMGMPPEGYAKIFTQHGPHQIGVVYRKALYREYTDATFEHLKPRPESERYLGILGPLIHAEVGDTIKIVFRNNGTHPYSMHPHGVLYAKASEGSPYADGVSASAKGGDAVAPGKTFTYEWDVPERAGPGPNDPSSIVWFYHSHVDERRDVNSGLIGAIVVTRQGMARPDGTPKDVDREFATLFMIFDENNSWFINQNLKRFVPNYKPSDKFKAGNVDPNGNFDALIGTGVPVVNFRSSINGYQFGNMPMPVMKRGDHVRWYVLTLGEGFNFHTPHWHGNTVLLNGSRVDIFSISPAQSLTADMVPDNPGIWMFHCHVSDHMESGMVADYKVTP